MKLAMPRMNKMRALTVPLVNCFWAQSQRKDSLPSAALGFRLRRGKRIRCFFEPSSKTNSMVTQGEDRLRTLDRLHKLNYIYMKIIVGVGC